MLSPGDLYMGTNSVVFYYKEIKRTNNVFDPHKQRWMLATLIEAETAGKIIPSIVLARMDDVENIKLFCLFPDKTCWIHIKYDHAW